MPNICTYCRKAIFLVKAGKTNYKWVSDKNRPSSTWKCRGDDDYPLRSHNPEYVDPLEDLE